MNTMARSLKGSLSRGWEIFADRTVSTHVPFYVPIENGIIDLGRLATDALYLGVDPYPRKPDAVFEPLVEAADPEDHPFAALKALKVAPKKSGARKSASKPKGK